MNDRVTCLMCSKSFKFLGSHVKVVHGITTDEYRHRFDGAPVVSEATAAKHSVHMKSQWKDEFFVEGFMLSQKFRQRDPEALAARMAMMNRDPEIRKKILTEETRAKYRASAVRRAADPNDSFAKARYDRLYDCKGFQMQSQYEVKFAEALRVPFLYDEKIIKVDLESRNFVRPDFYIPHLDWYVEINVKFTRDADQDSVNEWMLLNGYIYVELTYPDPDWSSVIESINSSYEEN